jgi:hypothetical protein
MARLADL